MSRPILVKGSPHVTRFSMMPGSELCLGCGTFIDPTVPHRLVWDNESEKWWRQCSECWSAEKAMVDQ